jgi:hypothetical protein
METAMRPPFRRFLTVALVLIAALCGAALLAGQMERSLAIQVWMGIAGLLLAMQGFTHVARRRSRWQADGEPRGGGWTSGRTGDAPTTTPDPPRD